VFPHFNRGSFLVRLGERWRIRRRDAGIGAENLLRARERYKPPNLRVR
jgi:hypothetical protein